MSNIKVGMTEKEAEEVYLEFSIKIVSSSTGYTPIIGVDEGSTKAVPGLALGGFPASVIATVNR